MNQIHLDRSIASFEYNPNIAPRLKVKTGQTLSVETRDPRSGALLTGKPGTLQPYPPPPGGKSNALTGPIFIENAEIGDVIAIHIKNIETVPTAYMAAADFGFVLPKGSIDSNHVGIVTVHDEWIEFNEKIKFRKKTMVGCVGVAHPDKPKSGMTGSFGGNFDHSVLKKNCKLFLPVFVPGGMLYLGDVHAAMGDGELSGGGVETAATVKFRVDLIKNYELKQPRFETENKIVTTGWSFDFAEARAMAVGDMLNLVVKSMKITSTEAMMLISNAADLKIGQACGNMEMTLRLEMYKFEDLKVLP